MAKTSSSSPPPADDTHAHDPHAGGGHHPVETPEQREDAERSQEVELAIGRGLRMPGLGITVVFAALSLAGLGALSHSAPRYSWTWLLLAVFILAWGMALARGGRPDETEAPPAPHH